MYSGKRNTSLTADDDSDPLTFLTCDGGQDLSDSLKEVESLTIKGGTEEIPTKESEELPNEIEMKRSGKNSGHLSNDDVEMNNSTAPDCPDPELQDEDPKPCHSKSLGASCGTSGIGSNGSSSNSSASANTSNTSGIKKRSSSSHRRNYRIGHLMLDSETSNDTDNIAEENALKKETFELSSDDSSDGDLPLNKYMKGEKSTTRVQEHDDDDESEAPLLEELGDRPAQHDDSPRLSDGSTPAALSDFDLDGDAALEGFFNVYHRGSSTSDSSEPEPEEPDSSSSSSDNFLEDIDERPPEPSRPTSSADDHVSSSERLATNQSTETDQAKKKLAKKRTKKKSELPRVLLKKKPVHNWNPTKELFHREIGLGSKMQPQAAEIFRSKFYGSLFSAERLELMKKLDGHNGCVNCLNFNHSGSKLASGSDDLLIKIWNYGVGKCLTSFKSGHKANVFQAKFVPLIGLDTIIVSCARDSQVRLTELSSTGTVCSSKKLIQHQGPAHKLSINADTPHVILSCGEDGLICSVDIRDEKPERLVKVTDSKGKKICLYSIHQNPFSPHEFCVTGRDQFVRIYDIRNLNRSSARVSDDHEQGSANSDPNSNEPMKKFCPHHLSESRPKPNVTAAVYNYNGAEIVASYNDENIYLFDSSHSDMADCIKVYEGHRNNVTVKGVNFFGDRSQYIVSGSDCGHIFIWDKETESIVNLLRGDENGVVNCLEGHPTAPILATSGLDNDVKIWIPSNEKVPHLGNLASTVRKNLKDREDELKNQAPFNQHVMWALWNHIRRSDPNRERRGVVEPAGDSDSNESPWNDNDDDEDSDDSAPNRSTDCTIC